MSELADYRIPGTNLVSWSAYSRDNIPKPAHDVPLGQVVWLEHGDEGNHGIERDADDREIVLTIQGREKLIVVGHGQDCDGTSLYHLAAKPIAIPNRHPIHDPMYWLICRRVEQNISRESITPVDGERLELSPSLKAYFGY